jgi:hypothetical protein
VSQEKFDIHNSLSAVPINLLYEADVIVEYDLNGAWVNITEFKPLSDGVMKHLRGLPVTRKRDVARMENIKL